MLWGTDNLKTEGGPIAQALCADRRRAPLRRYGRLAGATLMPLEELGRPRVDVVITLSGIFRDLLPLQIKLLAEAALPRGICGRAARAAISCANTPCAIMAEHGGDIETAALRVFGNADGAYGSNVNQLVDHGGWDERTNWPKPLSGARALPMA